MAQRPLFNLQFDDINGFWWFCEGIKPLFKLPKGRPAKYLAQQLIDLLNE